jgi:Leucine-rich repeat (LRR) protein
MSSMSTLWTSLGLPDNSQAKAEKQKAAIKEDLKYLYSAFTKVPCLRMAPDHRAPLISGYEEFPFDTAVPLFAFKNLSVLEITDQDFRTFCGWDRLADQLRSLTLKRANVDDPADLLINIVLDDMDKRRRRSAKQSSSPAIPLAAPSPAPRQGEFASSASTPDSPPQLERPVSGSLSSYPLGIHGSYQSRPRSTSPGRGNVSRHGSSHGHSRSGTPKLRRSSGSSVSSGKTNTPRGSASNLLSFGFLPSSKWRFLRHLSLAENGLTSLSASGLSPLANTLQSLDLSSNLFTEIPDSLASLVSLRSLNLSHCMIESLHSLGRNPLPAITTLNLRGNRLSSLAGIHRLLSLERLDLRENRLNDPTEIARLTGIPNMSEIYVYKNPFVKGYSNYRVTIFNLFRRTPGYIEDLLLDGHHPSYSERKLLVDRAPELPNVPIVKPPLEDERVPIPAAVLPRLDTRPYITPLQDPFYERRSSQDTAKPRRPSEYSSGSQRRRKGTRRRVVELSESDFAAERRLNSVSSVKLVEDPPLPPPPPPAKAAITDDSTYGGSEVESTPVRASRTTSDTPLATQLLSTLEINDPPPMLRTGSEPVPTQLPQFGTESDAYKQRIDALRNDFGNGWLSALSDDNWDAHLSPPVSMAPPVGPVRHASQGIISGSRTLG